MENTIQNVKKFSSDIYAQFKAAPSNKPNQSGVVFFIVDVQELFNVNLSFRGIIKCLNAAFMESKRYVPVATGLLKRSYTMERLDDHRVRCFFDPNKIVGQTRDGVVVKDYYPQYIAEHASRFNWLTIVIKKFYDKLYGEAKKLFKSQKDNPIKQKDPNKQQMFMFGVTEFMKELNQKYKTSKIEAKELKEKEEAERRAKKKAFKERKQKLKEQIEANKLSRGVTD